MAATFQVSHVERARRALRHSKASSAAATLFRAPVEAWGSTAPAPFPAGDNGLLGTVLTAFADHYPLVLTPDAIWLCIAQGFAIHVQLHAEELRGKFVRHEGKQQSTVRRDDFVKKAAYCLVVWAG